MNDLSEVEPGKITTHYATTQEEKESIYRFRYHIYVNEMGKDISDADHDKGWLYDDMDDTATLIYAKCDDQVIATLRYNQGGQTEFSQYWSDIYQLDKFSDFPIENLSLSSRIMVAKEWRGSSALGAILAEVYVYSRKQGVKFDFCNCSPSLLEFYEQLGYRRYAKGFIDANTGYHVPMILLTEDIAHMRKVRCLFTRIARKLPDNSSDTHDWFEKNFPKHNKYTNRRLVTSKEFWCLLQDKLANSLQGTLPLFDGLEADDIQRFLGMSTTIKCNPGDILIRPGDIGDEMFVILSGAVEVKSSLDDDAVLLRILGDGQIFGEMAFVSHTPRTAAVVAASELEVLILTQTFLNKAIKNMPEITASVLLNLSTILCERLHLSTEEWVSAAKESD